MNPPVGYAGPYNRLVRALLVLFFASIAFHTLLNPRGYLPASLMFALLISVALAARILRDRLIVPKFSALDCLMLCFVFMSTALTLRGLALSIDLNVNHLFAHFAVVLLYYFTLRCAIANAAFGRSPVRVLTMVGVLFWTITATVVVDYSLLLKGINIANYLPMEQANLVAGTGIFSRPRGFFVEPTDLSLALNALGPLLMIYYYLSNRSRAAAMTLIAFLVMQTLASSAAGLASLALGLLFAGADALLRWRPRFVLSKKALLSVFALLLALSILAAVFSEYVGENVRSMIAKIFFLEASGSAVNRMNSWRFTLSLFIDADNHWLGYGTGYMSANHESSLSWILSVLVENGIIGIMMLGLMFIFGVLYAARMNSAIRYGFYISLTAVLIHLMTNTGFYFPYLWLLLVLVQCDWSELGTQRPRMPVVQSEPGMLLSAQRDVGA
jgi:hypothetical protein